MDEYLSDKVSNGVERDIGQVLGTLGPSINMSDSWANIIIKMLSVKLWHLECGVKERTFSFAWRSDIGTFGDGWTVGQ